MQEQLAKRLTTQCVVQVLQQFNNHSITEKEACELLGIKRIQLYELRKRWLKANLKGEPFKLQASGENKKRSLTTEVQDFLHQELFYIKEEAFHYQEKFNFAFLSAGRKFHKKLANSLLFIKSKSYNHRCKI